MTARRRLTGQTFIVTDGFLLKGHNYHDGKRQTEGLGDGESRN